MSCATWFLCVWRVSLHFEAVDIFKRHDREGEGTYSFIHPHQVVYAKKTFNFVAVVSLVLQAKLMTFFWVCVAFGVCVALPSVNIIIEKFGLKWCAKWL